MDTTPPELVCPAPIVKSTLTTTCTANVQLPPATVTDDCSGFSVQTQTDVGVVNDNGGWIYNVPVGTYVVTYNATDECGNFATCTTTLTVVDDVEPVAVCDDFTVVSLTGDGTAQVSAETFDDGSLDNCQLDHFEVRRLPDNCIPSGTPFDEVVNFSCCDIGEMVVVVLRVYDSYGNYNDCMVSVEVQGQDNIAPTITCPPDKEIECGTDVSDLSQFGYPTYSDNCLAVELTSDSVYNINSCNVGAIYRFFTVTDEGGHTAQCTQTITIVNSDPFTLADIQWPADYTTTDCD
ncbi:MAG: HYR domain-containing protein, partial [Gammaproteobacteria bacterium]